MHRLICDSATYRQSSIDNAEALNVDADNILLWKKSMTRLEAESIRDSILVVSGQLNKTMGGPGYRDFKMYKHKGSWVYDATDPVAWSLTVEVFIELGHGAMFIHYWLRWIVLTHQHRRQ